MLKLFKEIRKTGDATVGYPFTPLEMPAGFRGKPEHNEKLCIACAACAIACPANAITMELDAEQNYLTWDISYGRCIFCGRCQEVCPLFAIELTTDFELAVTNKEDLRESCSYGVARCARCGKPYAPAKEVDYARRVLAGVGGSAAADIEKVDLCLDCRRIDDAEAFAHQAPERGEEEMLENDFPLDLQWRPDPVVLDAKVAEAKQKLLESIKRSVYVYRVDCGGCNGCEIEIFATITAVFDAERFGIKVVPSPRHADMLIYTGAMTRSMREPALRAYHAAPDPKIVMSYGARGCTGGIFHDNYCVWGGTDPILPVDVYVPGCPPSPPATIFGFATALGLLDQKLHASHHVAPAGEQAPVAFPAIPYKVRTAFEREARRMSGYYYGKQIVDEFMLALSKDTVDALGAADALIAAETDTRKRAVFMDLKALLLSKVVDE